jgi:hypothetical protein
MPLSEAALMNNILRSILSQSLFEIISKYTRTDSLVAQPLYSLFTNQAISRISV